MIRSQRLQGQHLTALSGWLRLQQLYESTLKQLMCKVSSVFYLTLSLFYVLKVMNSFVQRSSRDAAWSSQDSGELTKCHQQFLTSN